jgi:hypothetical protein
LTKDILTRACGHINIWHYYLDILGYFRHGVRFYRHLLAGVVVHKREKIEYHQLNAGYEFSPVTHRLDPARVFTYCNAVDENAGLYQEAKVVPPMAIAAFAMAALSENISLPPGTIHVSQEIEFKGTTAVDETIISYAKVSRKQDRGKLHLMTIELSVLNQDKREVLAGKTSFILPE